MTARPLALVLRCDADGCRSVAEELRSCGFETVEHTSIDAGLALLAGGTVDVAFCEASEVDGERRPVWQRVLAATSRRETFVVLLGRANSHQEMLAAGVGSRLALCPSSGEGVVSVRAREILNRSGLVATLHGAESVDGPRFAGRRALSATESAF